jgi:hypothetical protein
VPVRLYSLARIGAPTCMELQQFRHHCGNSVLAYSCCIVGVRARPVSHGSPAMYPQGSGVAPAGCDCKVGKQFRLSSHNGTISSVCLYVSVHRALDLRSCLQLRQDPITRIGNGVIAYTGMKLCRIGGTTRKTLTLLPARSGFAVLAYTGPVQAQAWPAKPKFRRAWPAKACPSCRPGPNNSLLSSGARSPTGRRS